jgi:uncharacterized membrane protein YdbT with pleckstrin-like domain
MAQEQQNQQFNPDIDQLLPSDLLSDDEVVLFAIKPSIWTVAFLSFRTTVVAVAIAAAAAVFAPALHIAGLTTHIVELCAAAILARIGFAFLQWLSRSYVLTDKRVIRIRGVFTIDIFQCALAKIQNTFLRLTLPQRVLGLGNIAFTTAGTGSVEAVWRHCKNPLDVHQKLIRVINAAANRRPVQPPAGSSPDGL